MLLALSAGIEPAAPDAFDAALEHRRLLAAEPPGHVARVPSIQQGKGVNVQFGDVVLPTAIEEVVVLAVSHALVEQPALSKNRTAEEAASQVRHAVGNGAVIPAVRRRPELTHEALRDSGAGMILE